MSWNGGMVEADSRATEIKERVTETGRLGRERWVAEEGGGNGGAS
jgi:rhamnose utilization protein RhaD (predicted bifunctional aldolase and dehydrogenase)